MELCLKTFKFLIGNKIFLVFFYWQTFYKNCTFNHWWFRRNARKSFYLINLEILEIFSYKNLICSKLRSFLFKIKEHFVTNYIHFVLHYEHFVTNFDHFVSNYEHFVQNCEHFVPHCEHFNQNYEHFVQN